MDESDGLNLYIIVAGIVNLLICVVSIIIGASALWFIILTGSTGVICLAGLPIILKLEKDGNL